MILALLVATATTSSCGPSPFVGPDDAPVSPEVAWLDCRAREEIRERDRELAREKLRRLRAEDALDLAQRALALPAPAPPPRWPAAALMGAGAGLGVAVATCPSSTCRQVTAAGAAALAVGGLISWLIAEVQR